MMMLGEATIHLVADTRAEHAAVGTQMSGECAQSKWSGICDVQQWMGLEAFHNLTEIRILVVGAGGLGCEILKNLAVCGFEHLDIIDMDVIELTNLNRQFLFREHDIGKYKADIAAEKVTEMTGTPVRSHVSTVQDMPDSFYEQFHIVISGLDNVEARRWINAKLVQLCLSDLSPRGLRPLIDGGSEGFRGQCRVILPGLTPCYECTLSLLLPETATNYALCTIASVPRLPEHCIQWASMVKWPRQFGDRVPDFESTEDMVWLFEAARERAALFNIEGVTIELVYGVLKRIIPAVASTNAIIAASCSLEALKLASGKLGPIDNYFMYAGDSGVFSSIVRFQKREDCPVCGTQLINITVDAHRQLQDVLTDAMKMLHPGVDLEQVGLPSVTMATGAALYMSNPPTLREQTKENLIKPINQLLPEGHGKLALTHSKITSPIHLSVAIK